MNLAPCFWPGSRRVAGAIFLGMSAWMQPLGTFPLLARESADPVSSRTFSLSGADWRIHDDPDGQGVDRRWFEADTSSAGWIAATVPGNIQADLEAAHQLTPLWYGVGDARLHEAACKDWWYRKDVAVPSTFAGKRLTLVFDGVDHECEVFLNGRRIGGNAGMYKRFWFDVTPALQPGQVNRLAVRIARMPEELRATVLSADAPGGPNVGTASNAVRQRLKELKSPTNSAYDWAVAIYTLGIWKDVWLETTGSARLDWVGVSSALSENYSQADLRVRLDLDSLAGLPVKVAINAFHGSSGARTTITANLTSGTNHLETTFRVRKPALWWPTGQGQQPLYRLVVEVRHADTDALLDRRTTRFGIREIRWDQTPGTPADFINPLKLVVNGRPVRQMGSNLLPPDSLFGRMDVRGLRLLGLARAAGVNCLRLWGGGVILSESMYDRADELGITLLQEFPLANSQPERDPVFLAHLETTAVNIVKQVRNHPSILEWSGGNEMIWKNGTDDPALHVLEKAVRECDDRFLRATEPAQGSGAHGSYTYVYHTEPAGYLSWLGAGAQNLYQRYDTSVEMRISEFGTHSPANLEVWQRTIPPASQWPLTNYDDPVLIRKNVFWGAVLKENWLHKEITERLFGPLDGLEQLVPAGQFLGAEGLRYAMDALRRKGPALGGGFMSWNYNEPWPNGAGSYMVDYDGRPLMNFDFVRQALAAVSLSLQYPSLLYDPATGVSAQLFLASDAPATARHLHWHWRARDRHGKMFAEGSGVTDAIQPQGVIPLESLRLRPPRETALGPVFVELALTDAQGRTLAERLHVFGARAVRGPLAGLLRNGLPDRDDTADAAVAAPDPRSPQNLAWVGNGAAPATASAELPGFEHHRAKGLNDGAYGNSQSWIGGVANASFTIELGQVAEIGRFRLGRDRTGGYTDRSLDSLKLEVSVDAALWQPVFDRQGLAALPAYRPAATLEIQVPPVRAKWVRATVNPANVCLDEFEIYAPAGGSVENLPRIRLEEEELAPRPVTRTVLQVEARPVRLQGEQEALDLAVKNTGPMTALFCEPHPLLEYRTDLFIDNNHCCIPPGETRTLTIRAPRQAGGGLSLAQTGWRISTWNADQRVIEPAPSVLLALGRRDAMCREFAGYGQPPTLTGEATVELQGRRPDPGRLPYLLGGPRQVRFSFEAKQAQIKGPARLRIHLSDLDSTADPVLRIVVNLQHYRRALPRGLGIQKNQPYHLAFPVTAVFDLPPGLLKAGKNTVEMGLANPSWVTLDALDLVTR